MQSKAIIRFAMAVTLVVGALSMASCARQISSDVYDADHIGEASSTFPGTIIHTRQITVQDGERLQDNTLGIVGGGAAGALVGSQIGKGKGNDLAMIGGALAGAVGGAFAEKALKTQQGIEYIVQLDNGQTMTVVQGPSPAFSVGQKVHVMIGQKGRSRLIPQ